MSDYAIGNVLLFVLLLVIAGTITLLGLTAYDGSPEHDEAPACEVIREIT